MGDRIEIAGVRGNVMDLNLLTTRLTQDDDWRLAEEIILNAAKEECAPYIEATRRYLKKIEGKNWLDAPSVEPRVTIQIPEANQITLLLRVPSPTHRPSRAEQAILRRFLVEYHSRQTQAIPENLATMV